jgi:hypothetical protein
VAGEVETAELPQEGVDEEPQEASTEEVELHGAGEEDEEAAGGAGEIAEEEEGELSGPSTPYKRTRVDPTKARLMLIKTTPNNKKIFMGWEISEAGQAPA